MKHLILMRHGEAVSISRDNDDFDRKLTQLGNFSVLEAANFLSVLEIDKVKTSSAVRTSQTAGIALSKNKLSKHKLAKSPAEKFQVLDELYQISSERLIEEISLESTDVNSLMIVGHNPALSELLSHLCWTQVSTPPENIKKKESVEDTDENFNTKNTEIISLIRHGFPPGAVTIIELDIDKWGDISFGCGEIIDLFIPSSTI